MTGERTTPLNRRGFLAGIAAATGTALAGCLDDLPWRDGGSSGTIPAGKVDGVLTDDRPPIEWPAPVEPSADAIEDAGARIEELLDPIPEPLTATDVPNGVVRQSIASHRRDAAEVRDAGDHYQDLRDTPSAREAARHARTTFDAIERDRETLVSELRTERSDASDAVRTQLEAIEYRGQETPEGRLRAALVARQREHDLVGAERTIDRWRIAATDNVIELGEAAGDIESAAATAAVWSHLSNRYEADRTAAIDLEPAFSDALDRSLDRVAAVDFPEQDDEGWYAAVGADDLDDQFLEFALWRAGREVIDAADGVETASDEGRLGTGLYYALLFEQRYRAFERFRDRVRDGSVDWPASVPEIEAERSAAFEAAQAARESISGPTPGALALAETLQSLGWIDERVGTAADTDPETHVSLSDEYRDYALRRAELSVLPDAVAAFRDRLRTA